MNAVLCWLWGMSSLAAPDRIAHTIEIGTQVSDVATAADGSTVAMVDEATGTLHFVDTRTWDLVSASPCTGIAGVAPWDEARFYVGCGDGSITWVEFNDGKVTQAEAAFALANTAILGIATNDTFVFALAEHETGGNPQVHAYNPADGAASSYGYPSTLGYSGYADLDANSGYVFVAHGGATMSKVEAGSGGATIQQSAPGAAKTEDVLTVGTSKVYVAGGPSGVLEFEYSTNRLTLFLTEGAGVESATAIAADLEGEFFAVADDDQREILLYDLDRSVGIPTPDQIDAFTMPADGGTVNEFGVLEGYLFAGTDAGALWVMTENPWVTAGAASPAAAINGTEVSIPFSSDTAGEWSARVGASSNTDGKEVASGTVDAGGEGVAVFTVDAQFAEGDNPVRIVVSDGDGLSGHDTASVNVDNPPGRVGLSANDVGFGDQMVSIEINGIDDEDLSHYMVYLSTETFSGDAYPTGGPDFVGSPEDASASKIGLPKRVNASPGKDKTISIKPLTNGVTYYVAIRAVDAGGQEGQMSKVRTAIPRETYGAAQLAGEAGGMQCGSVNRVATWLMALLGGLVVLGRRTGVAIVVLGMLGLGVSSPAEASEWPQSGKTFEDFTGSAFEIRYGPMALSDDSLTQVFGSDGNNVLWLETGPTLFDLIELTGSIGYWRDEGKLVSASGKKSSQKDTILVIPVAADATFRFDVIPEQIIVPFVGIGYDYWFWRESWAAGGAGSGDELAGGKSGTHTSYGAHLLLDLIQPGRASKLEAKTGITDTFLTVEWREQMIGEEQEGLEFSGDVLTIGLKLDY